MKLKEIIKYIETKYKVKFTKKTYWGAINYSLFAKDLDYIDFQNKRGLGRKVINLVPSGSHKALFEVLIPSKDIIESDIVFLTTNRKRNLWTDDYTKSYSDWETYVCENLTEEKIDKILTEQKNKYMFLNGLHDEKEMKTLLDNVKNLKEEIKLKQKSLSVLKIKISDMCKRRLSIEEE